MRTVIQKSLSAVVVAAIVALVAFFNAGTAKAQCGSVTVNNNTGSPLSFDLYWVDGMGAQHTVSFSVPAGTSSINGSGPVQGVLSAMGQQVPFNPLTGCTGCVSIKVTGGNAICCTFCLGPGACTMTITAPCGPPCTQ